MVTAFVPTIVDVTCVLGIEPQGERRRIMRRLGITDVILDTDMIGSVCVGIMDDGSIFADADAAVLAGETEPDESLSSVIGRLLALAKGG